MARIQRQREPLKSGWVVKDVVVGPQNTPQETVLQIPGVGSPMDVTGTLRDAPSQWLSLWAGIRPTVDFNAQTVGGIVKCQVEVGVVPYNRNPARSRSITREARPLYTPLNPLAGNARVSTAYNNVLGQKALVPWPPGALLVRVTFEWSQQQSLGTEVDVVAAWAVCSVPTYPQLPALDDLRDL